MKPRPASARATGIAKIALLRFFSGGGGASRGTAATVRSAIECSARGASESACAGTVLPVGDSGKTGTGGGRSASAPVDSTDGATDDISLVATNVGAKGDATAGAATGDTPEAIAD